jgi:CRISPR system Cascade subunit CasC
MARFIQIHLLTSYPPANLNRDDMGRPKTAKMGGVDRLRVSSQSLKRAWRTSDVFAEALSEYLGIRTKEFGRLIFDRLQNAGVASKKAHDWAGAIAGAFGKRKPTDKKNPEAMPDLEIEQLAHISPEERSEAEKLADTLAREDRPPADDELRLLRVPSSAVDIAMFGRMLADPDKRRYEAEAACQVSHALSVHRIVVEDDYFTAVDDLNRVEEDRGAAHIGETGFAAGVFYTYVCVNRELLLENLGGEAQLADRAIATLIRTAATVSPSGKQNSFASRAYASYVMVEKGDDQPRSLSVAFLKPIGGSDYAADAIVAIEKTASNMDASYGLHATERRSMNAMTGEGTLDGLIAFAKE